MKDVSAQDLNEKEIFLDTGSPHRIIFCHEVGDINVKKEGSKIRFSTQYEENGGTNVNYVQQLENDLFLVRTYERGVEDETLSCGTGATAVGIVAGKLGLNSPVSIQTMGGDLSVFFQQNGNSFTNIWLAGPAEKVFEGSVTI